MASRRDQLHSYQFMIQRTLSALVMRETDPVQSPLRRGVGAVFAGLMISVIVTAVFGVIGILTKTGSNQWQKDNSVVVEKESGAVYVYRHGTLHPMLNFASALLASGSTPAAAFQESAKSLRGTPRGVMLGISGAPMSLPGRGTAVHGAWSMCSVPGTDDAGRAMTSTRLAIGSTPGGAQTIGDRALLVSDEADHTDYLIWRSHRYRIGHPDTVLRSLYRAGSTPIPVGSGWLNGLPSGLAIDTVDVPDRGSASQAVTGHDNGDVLFANTGTGKQYYLVFADGLAPITHLTENVVAGEYAVTPAEIPLSDANSLPPSSKLPTSGDRSVRQPDEPPTLLSPDPGAQLCAVTRPGQSAATIMLGGSPAAGGTSTSGTGTSGTALADQVVLAPGQVAVVEVMASPAAKAGAFNLITDIGMRYPVSSSTALASLGYLPDDAVRMPANLVNLVPAGPSLDPSAANRAAHTGPK